MQTRKLTYILGGVVAVATFALYQVFSYKTFTPELTAWACDLAGLRPSDAFFPGIWRMLALLVPTTAFSLGLVGHLAAALFAVTLYFVYIAAFRVLLRVGEKVHPATDVVSRSMAAFGALSCVFADPIWRVFIFFTPAGLTLVMVALAVLAYLRWFIANNVSVACAGLAVLGVLSAETPLGWVILLLFVVGYRVIWPILENGDFRPDGEFLDLSELPYWRMFLCLFGSFLLTVVANVEFLRFRGGEAALGAEGAQLYLSYFSQYTRLLLDAATPTGWVLTLGVVVAPFLVAVKLFPRTADDFTAPVNFSMGLLFLAAGVLAYFQQGPFRSGWFWTWIGKSESIVSPTMLAFVVLLASAAFALAAAAFVFDAAFHASLRSRGANGVFAAVLLIAGVAVSAACVCSLPHGNVRRILAFVEKGVREIVRECGDAKWVFTDGNLDAWIELEAHRQGRELYAIDLIHETGKAGMRLRRRGCTEAIDLQCADMGAPVMLRSWAETKPGGLDPVALTVGFEFWKRDNKPYPPRSAFVGRTKGLSPEDVANADRIAKEFAAEIVELAPLADRSETPPTIRDAFSSVVWRLSRMARLRSDEALAQKLDVCNSALKRMLELLEYERIRAFMQLTPQEGLRLALRRADFVEARRFAAGVLQQDAEDTEANFAMGMSYLLSKKYADCEFYLRKCLVRRPNEPAVLNNLSIACRRQGKFDEALKLAEQAYAVMPESPEVRETLADAKAKKP